MRIIGITGGIGSGKSTVSKILMEFGAKVIDADVISRDIVQKGQKALEDIVQTFGKDILTEDGSLDRSKLGNIVFTDKHKLESLNSITHKYIKKKIIENINITKKEGYTGLTVIDAAIPFQHGFIDTVDEVWVVIADMETRIKRVMSRSGLSRLQVLDRIKSQMSEKNYLMFADRVLINNGCIDELEKQVKNFYLKVI